MSKRLSVLIFKSKDNGNAIVVHSRVFVFVWFFLSLQYVKHVYNMLQRSINVLVLKRDLDLTFLFISTYLLRLCKEEKRAHTIDKYIQKHFNVDIDMSINQSSTRRIFPSNF